MNLLSISFSSFFFVRSENQVVRRGPGMGLGPQSILNLRIWRCSEVEKRVVENIRFMFTDGAAFSSLVLSTVGLGGRSTQVGFFGELFLLLSPEVGRPGLKGTRRSRLSLRSCGPSGRLPAEVRVPARSSRGRGSAPSERGGVEGGWFRPRRQDGSHSLQVLCEAFC